MKLSDTETETEAVAVAAPTDPTLRLVGLAIGMFAVGGYLYWLLSAGLVKEGNWIGVDFHVYYQAAQVLRRGADIYNADISPPYVYPPLLALLVVPLSLLPVVTATMAWKLLQHLCLLASGALLLSLLPRGLRPLAGGLLLLGLLTVPVQDEIQVGESNSLILLLVTAALWLVARSQKPTEVTTPSAREPFLGAFIPPLAAAGVLLAVATSIKVLPVLLVAYFWWRGPRSVAAVATAGFMLLQLVLLALTPSTADYWFTQFPALFSQPFPYLDNQSLNAFLARALTPGSDPQMPPMQLFDGVGLRPVLTWLLNILVVAATVLVLWAANRRTDASPRPRSASRLLLEAGLVLLTLHLVSGSTWLHHLVDLAVPIAGLLGVWWLASKGSAVPAAPWTPLLGIALGFALALLLHRPGDWVLLTNTVAPGHPSLALLASGVALWSVMGLWVAVAVALLRQQASVSQTERY
ncbi:MAG: glycosyltransferase 87 family protein [Chloroflexia bacterium]